MLLICAYKNIIKIFCLVLGTHPIAFISHLWHHSCSGIIPGGNTGTIWVSENQIWIGHMPGKYLTCCIIFPASIDKLDKVFKMILNSRHSDSNLVSVDSVILSKVLFSDVLSSVPLRCVYFNRHNLPSSESSCAFEISIVLKLLLIVWYDISI